MVTAPLAIASELIHLSGISWQTYESLLNELTERRFRLTYHRGNLEIMAPSPEHEYNKKVLGRFVETLAEALELQIYPLGSTTLNRAQLCINAQTPHTHLTSENLYSFVNLVYPRKPLD